MYSFGEWVRRQRMGLQLTQSDLAERAFCSINTIKKIESDQRRPSRELAATPATALGAPTALHALPADCARGVRPVEAPASAQADVTAGTGFGRILSPLIGRDADLRLLLHLLDTACIVTIVGQGGSGKTRLAQAVLAQFHIQQRTAVFVPLVGLTGVADLAPAIALALGLELSARYEPVAQLLDALCTRSLLPVLDLVWPVRLALAEGNPARAAELVEEAGALLLAFGRRHGYGAALEAPATAAPAQGDTVQARRHLTAAVELYHDIGNEQIAEATRRALNRLTEPDTGHTDAQ